MTARTQEKVLEDDPDNLKALFRLGQACVGIHEYHLRVISIRTGILNWLRFTYDFEIGSD